MSVEYRHNTSAQLDILYHLQNVSSAFVHGLSIIDVLMFNSQRQIRDMLKSYELV